MAEQPELGLMEGGRAVLTKFLGEELAATIFATLLFGIPTFIQLGNPTISQETKAWAVQGWMDNVWPLWIGYFGLKGMVVLRGAVRDYAVNREAPKPKTMEAVVPLVNVTNQPSVGANTAETVNQSVMPPKKSNPLAGLRRQP